MTGIATVMAGVARLRVAVFALAGAGAILSGCVHASAGGVGPTGAPSDRDARPEGRAEGQTPSELDQRKDRLVEELRGEVPASMGDPARCEGLCTLATSICGVQEKICALADEHPAQDEYQHLCREAKRECAEAQDACIRCVERHAGSPSSTATPP